MPAELNVPEELDGVITITDELRTISDVDDMPMELDIPAELDVPVVLEEPAMDEPVTLDPIALNPIALDPIALEATMALDSPSPATISESFAQWKRNPVIANKPI